MRCSPVLVAVAVVAVVAVAACGSTPAKKHSHDHSSGMPHRFDDAAHWSKVFDDPARDTWQEPERVIAALALTRDLAVADVGAGTGYFTVKLAPLAKEVIATDIEPNLVDHMNRRVRREGHANVRVQLTPPDDPQLPMVDRILVVDVWHHLRDRQAYAKKLAAALAPGGFILVVDFKLDARLGPPKAHRLAPAAIVEDLRAAGLTAKLEEELTEQYIVIGRR